MERRALCFSNQSVIKHSLSDKARMFNCTFGQTTLCKAIETHSCPCDLEAKLCQTHSRVGRRQRLQKTAIGTPPFSTSLRQNRGPEPFFSLVSRHQHHKYYAYFHEDPRISDNVDAFPLPNDLMCPRIGPMTNHKLLDFIALPRNFIWNWPNF